MADPELFEARGDYVGGEFALPAPSGEIALEDPGDLDALTGAFPFAAESVERAVGAARAAFPGWRDTPAEERAACLRRLADAIRAAETPLARVIAREVGKPVWEARTEVAAMVGKVEITLGAGLDEIRERSFELPGGQVGRWRAHARGALAVLGPFNFPGHLVHGHVVPALATGNTVVIKPSERTPATGQLYAELCRRAGFPPGVVNLIQGDGSSGAALAAHAGLDGVLFTGSWSVGRRILEATLDQPHKLVALEMGGKNAAIVCPDADLDVAAYQIAFGAAVTAGQRCSATSRVLVDRRVSGPLTERLVAHLERMRVGYPLDDDVFMGPVISAAACARHADVCKWAREEGADALVTGGPIDGPRRGHYVRPSLHRVRELRPESRYQSDEHFVPDLALLETGSLDEAIRALDVGGYGLVASVFTRNRAFFEQVWRESRLGLLNWNTATVGASSKLPFGGVGKSGNDRPAGALSTVYCTYPVASIELDSPGPAAGVPGFPWAP